MAAFSGCSLAVSLSFLSVGCGSCVKSALMRLIAVFGYVIAVFGYVIAGSGSDVDKLRCLVSVIGLAVLGAVRFLCGLGTTELILIVWAVPISHLASMTLASEQGQAVGGPTGRVQSHQP